MKSYYVGITVYNSVLVNANSKEEAERIVRELSDFELLDDADFNITYVQDTEE
jgi:hypothetical protein